MPESQQTPTVYVPTRYHKLGHLNVEELLDQISDGKTPAWLAQEHGCTRAAMHYKLREHPDYSNCREIGMEIKLDDGLEKLVQTEDLNSARMEEVKLRRLEWRAEREFPHRWGAKQQLAIGVAPSIDQALVGLASDLLAKLAAAHVLSVAVQAEDVELSTDDDPQPVDNSEQI